MVQYSDMVAAANVPASIRKHNPVVQVRMIRAAGGSAADINAAKARANAWLAAGRPANWGQGGPTAPAPQMAAPQIPVFNPEDIASPDYVEDFTVYQLDFTLAAGASQTQSIPIQADSAFKWTKAAYYATIANAAFTATTRPIPNMTIQVTDTGSGRVLFNNPVPIPSIFGEGELPFILPVERIFDARSSMQVTVANFDAAVTYTTRLSFIGSKIFKYGT